MNALIISSASDTLIGDDAPEFLEYALATDRMKATVQHHPKADVGISNSTVLRELGD